MADGPDKESSKICSDEDVTEKKAAELDCSAVQINVVPATPRMGESTQKYVNVKITSDDEKEEFYMIDPLPVPCVRETKAEEPASQAPISVLHGPKFLSEERSESSKTRRKKLKSNENRDPNRLHEAVQVNFEDIIGEPDEIRSFNAIWGTSHTIYKATNYWFYRILSLIFGIPCSILWGLYFACMAFTGVWCLMPVLRAFALPMTFVKKLCSITVRSLLDPWFESTSLLFSNIRIWFSHRD